MAEFFSDMTFWHWFIFGGVLIILEMLLPSTLFLWPGISAVALGVQR